MKKIAAKVVVFIMVLLIAALPVSARELIPGGQVIGMHLKDDSVSITAIDDTVGVAAKAAGLEPGDRILSVNGQTVSAPGDIRQALQRCDGKAELVILRQGKAKKLQLEPTVTGDGPRLGVYLKQGTTGIGTVTYYDPATTGFGALGHGVNNPSGQLLEMTAGDIYQASVLSVKKGKSGTPGQLMGTVTAPASLGSLEKNTTQGVFGTTAAPAEGVMTTGQATTGDATIRSTVNGKSLREYSVKILKIYPNSGAAGRNLLLKVTDPELLAATGGIVQGMSGSPIIQDGKLVGAVTHVLVNDPTAGYGIFIENMLDAAA